MAKLSYGVVILVSGEEQEVLAQFYVAGSFCVSDDTRNFSVQGKAISVISSTISSFFHSSSDKIICRVSYSLGVSRVATDEKGAEGREVEDDSGYRFILYRDYRV